MAGLDWSGSSGPKATLGPLKPCIADCGGLTLLRAPLSKMPLHKTCAQQRPDLAAHWGGALPATGDVGTLSRADDPAPF